jgi:3-phenylpropionate/cinnamic acid dioxygenase small subunit
MSPTDVAADRRAASRAAKPLDVQACEQFLLHEARLLDEGRFDEWLALFTPDASYWVPSSGSEKPARYRLADL